MALRKFRRAASIDAQRIFCDLPLKLIQLKLRKLLA
jgi:hypothetical protein